MKPSVLLRAASLEGRAIARQLGLVPLTCGVIVILIALQQEPAIFRLQGVDLAWPAIYAAADFIVLLTCLASSPPARTTPASIGLRLARAGAALMLGLLAASALIVAGLGVDRIAGATTPWSALPGASLRLVLVWAPIALLGQSPLVPAGTLTRFLTLLAAFLVQCGVHPASLHVGLPGIPGILAASLAMAGGLLALTEPHP
ncbi:MAG: hypothetical protein AB7O97_11895 [Planctomycetota bacterium]